VRVLKIKLNQF